MYEKEAIINKLRLMVKEQNSVSSQTILDDQMTHRLQLQTIQQEQTSVQQHYYPQKELECSTQQWLHDKEAEMVSLRSQIDVSLHLLMWAEVDKYTGKRCIDGIAKNYRLEYLTLKTLLLGNTGLKWRHYNNNLR